MDTSSNSLMIHAVAKQQLPGIASARPMTADRECLQAIDTFSGVRG